MLYECSLLRYRRFRAHTYPTCPRLIAFEGDTCVFGLNFYDFNEAAKFEEHLSKRYEQEAKSGKYQFVTFYLRF